MALRIAINGFGRIGRLALRSLIERNRHDVKVMAINDLAAIDMSAHLLRYDSVHGPFPADVSIDNDTIDVGRGPINVYSCANPSDLPWESLQIDVVLECTGRFTSHEKSSGHLEAGARRVVVSAPCTDADLTVVQGVNHDLLQYGHVIVSNASCTTNCLAPLAKVLHQNFGLRSGFMTTIHAVTGDQPSVDTAHSDPYRARAAFSSMIPTSTGAARAVGLVLPELEGRLDGVAIRVPTANVSAVDLVCLTEKKVSVDGVNDAFRSAAAADPLKGILAVSDEPLVSCDFNHTLASSTVATSQTRVGRDGLLRVLAWYDNEWAFSNRLVDTVIAVGKQIAH